MIFYHYQPMHSRFKNRLEMANEFLLMTSAYHLFYFSDFGTDQIQQTAGYSLLGNLALLLGINFVVFLYHTLNHLRLLICVKGKNKGLKKLYGKYLQTYLP